MVSEKPIASRFWSKVALKQFGCWEWMAAKGKTGYGVFGVSRGRNYRAHRFAYEQVNGPIPQGLSVDHLCRNRGCVNPEHLEVVTQRENLLRGEGFAAINSKKNALR